MANRFKTQSVLRTTSAAPAQRRLIANCSARLLLTSVLGGLVALAVLPNPAYAQGLVCETGGGSATGSPDNVACGPSANADGTNGRNTAIGQGANASGGTTGQGQLGSWNTAIGSGATATSTQAGRNVAIGVISSATGNGFNTAIGVQATASGDNGNNIAQGFLARANGGGSGSIAIGASANADGANMNNTAVGRSSNATGRNSSAFGSSARATHASAAAFGTGATTSRDNQQMFGVTTSTYTMAGVTSADSATAQGTATRLVSSNEAGDLAARTFSDLGLVTETDLVTLDSQVESNTSATTQNAENINQVAAETSKNTTSIRKNTASIRSNTARIDSNTSRIGSLENRVDRQEEQINKNTEGVAMAMAMEMPFLDSDKNFALVGHWGTYDGGNALAVGGLYRVAGDFFMSAGVGVGLNEGKVGGRAGFMKQW